MCSHITNAFENARLSISSAASHVGSGIKAGAQSAGSGIATGVHTAGKCVYTGYYFAGRKVEQFLHFVLPERVAKIASTIVWALPYTVAAVMVPATVNLIAMGAATSLWPHFGYNIDASVGKEHRQYAYIGLRNASLILVGLDIVKWSATGNWHLLLPIIFNLGFALQANKISSEDTPEKKVATPKDTTPQPAT